MEGNIIKWIQYDNKLKEYNEKSKKIREEKDKLSNDLIVSVNESSESGNLPVYNITNLNTSLTFQKSKVYENYTNQFYKECFTEFLGSEEKATELILFMKSKRKIEEKVSIKRGYIMDI